MDMKKVGVIKRKLGVCVSTCVYVRVYVCMCVCLVEGRGKGGVCFVLM